MSILVTSKLGKNFTNIKLLKLFFTKIQVGVKYKLKLISDMP